MSYPQYGYSYPSQANSTSLNTSQLLVPGNSSLSTPPTSTCDTSARVLTSETTPPSGGCTQQTMYSASVLSYPRVAGLADTVYSSAYATQGYVPFGADPSAFYSPLSTDNTEAWRSLSGTAGWPYDPSTMAGYPYGTSYGGLDVRRKNATRESTSTLKAWLYEHIKNPYPTKGEKIMLAIITKMTLTQVSTWFANARRRLKKENKMQWSPRNRSGEDDDRKSDDDNDDVDDSATAAVANNNSNNTTSGNSSSNNTGDMHSNEALRDGHHSNANGGGHSNNNNNSSKSLSEGGATADDGMAQAPPGFGALIGGESGHEDLMASGNHGNGRDTFGSLHPNGADPLQLRRDEDEDIVVDGGDNDPLSRLDFSAHDHQMAHHPRLKADDNLQQHPQQHPQQQQQHKLDQYDDSPLSQLSTPLGSPSHSLGDSLLAHHSQHPHQLGVKGHPAHCSTANGVSKEVLTPGGAGGDMSSKPRIWSLADVATSTTPPPGRRSPNLLVSSLSANRNGPTAFTSPVTSQPAAAGHVSSFQPWVGAGTAPSSYAPVGSHVTSMTSYGYPVNGQMSGGVMESGSSLGGVTGLSNSTSYSTAAKLSSAFLGDKPSLIQYQSGFNCNPEAGQTAFKPVGKRL